MGILSRFFFQKRTPELDLARIEHEQRMRFNPCAALIRISWCGRSTPFALVSWATSRRSLMSWKTAMI